MTEFTLKQKKEAIKLMEIMGVKPIIIELFKEEDRVVMFENHMACLADDDQLVKIQRLEAEYGMKVFMIIRSHAFFGVLDDYLFVSKYDDEWEMERDEARDGYALSYCMNRTYPELSEMGTIGFEVDKDGTVSRHA